jgi:hypothetical protein
MGEDKQKREHKIVKRPKDKLAENEQWLDEMADQGWELVAVSGPTDLDVRPTFYFRRPRTN